MTFAVIETGGKQYQVETGDVITIEKLSDTQKEGDKVIFDRVLLTDDGTATNVGAPYIDGAKVSGEVESIGRNAKVTTIKYKPKSNYRVKTGHRQPHVKVKITDLK
ncbi:50S ribosomal protein L21 [Candidatus Wolfebacteria bacterium]|nr:MAG: 50S ribosomal protein L21 [Candidatus Wolfebacteria bacterium]